MFETLKKGKYEVHAREEIISLYGYDVERIGQWKWSDVTYNIFQDMKRKGAVNQDMYTVLLVDYLEKNGYI